MLHRFEGDDGRRRLHETVLEQLVVAHDTSIATELVEHLTLTKHVTGDVIIAQDGTDTDIHLILVGSVGIEVNGHEVAIRRAGQHIGEMAMIDPTAKRSATIRAKEEAVLARIEERLFTAIADRHPRMWRRLAVVLGQRLRERGTLVPPKKDKPVVFIGSTAERLPVARALQTACRHDPWLTRIWTDGVFGAGKTSIESLAGQVVTVDFGLLVVTADDLVEMRGKASTSPRDNVVFELGLLMGALGRDRVFMVRLRDERDIKLPSDLLGVTALEVLPGSPEDLAARVGPAVDEFRTIVTRLGCR